MKKYTVLFIFLLLTSFFIHAESAKSKYSINVEKKSIDIFNNNNNFIIKDIIFNIGNKKDLLKFFKLKIGDNISKYKINTILTKYNYAFKEMHLYIFNINKINNNKIILFFKLKNWPLIENINIKGINISYFKKNFNTLIKKNKYYNIKNGILLSDNLIIDIKNNIKNFFIKKGIYNIYIIFTIIKNDLHISILNRNNIKNKITNIIFEGNKNISYNKLISILYKKNLELNKVIYYLNKYNIINYYKSLGFINAKIIKEKFFKTKNNNYILYIKLYEGDKFFLRNIFFKGNKIFDSNFLNNKFSFLKRKNNLIDINKIIRDNISSFYLDKGYLFFKIKINEKVIKNNQIDLYVYIYEGPIITLNKVKLSGNLKTKDNIIINEITTYPGKVFSKKEIENTIIRLSNLGYIKAKNELKLNSNNTVDLEWKISELNNNKIFLNSSIIDDKLVFNIVYNIYNFSILDKFRNPLNPIGSGEYLSLNTKLGLNIQNIGILFIKPLINNTSLLINIDLKNQKIISNNLNNNLKDDDSYKDNIFNKFIYNHINNIFNIKNNIKKYLSWDDNDDNKENKYNIGFSIGINKIINNFNIKSFINYYIYNNGVDINYNFIYNANSLPQQHDNFFYTQTGSVFNINTIFTLPSFKNLELFEYYKIELSGFLYKEIFNNLIAKIGLEFGMLGNYTNKNYRFPININNLILNIRGYDSNSDFIKNKIFLEIIYPFFIKNPFFNQQIKIGILGFLEAGNIYSNIKNYNPLDLKKSIGTGFRIFIPYIGILGIDIGYGFDNSNYKLHFIIDR
ncbi:MAG: hypothetical protein NHF98_00810 [Candidatus Bostrichicola ureolyticus]|nr:MAG: hypothetical protein NHF98_00810 [Candidatus Bostrichicola ureolyticus]